MIRSLALALGLVGFVILNLSGCAAPASVPSASSGLQITVSVVPQKYFVQRVGGEHVTVNVMVLPGANPATYEPKPEQLKALSRADAYISIGVPFEETWLPKIRAANDSMLIVDGGQGIERQPIADHHHEGEPAAANEGEHLDPHIWLSPRLVRIQASTVASVLTELDPEHGADYAANLAAFQADIDALDVEIHQQLDGLNNRKFMVFHPSWGYFAKDYGLEMIPVEVGGQEPSAQELAALISEAESEGIRVIFAQPEFSTRSAKTIAQEIGGQVLLISPLAEDWLENLRSIAQEFSAALGG